MFAIVFFSFFINSAGAHAPKHHTHHNVKRHYRYNTHVRHDVVWVEGSGWIPMCRVRWVPGHYTGPLTNRRWVPGRFIVLKR